MRLTVLDAGRVGSAIIKDLASEADFQVTAIDINADALARLERAASVRTIHLKERVEEIDGAPSALRGFR